MSDRELITPEDLSMDAIRYVLGAQGIYSYPDDSGDLIVPGNGFSLGVLIRMRKTKTVIRIATFCTFRRYIERTQRLTCVNNINSEFQTINAFLDEDTLHIVRDIITTGGIAKSNFVESVRSVMIQSAKAVRAHGGGLLDETKIMGVGPSREQQVWEALGIIQNLQGGINPISGEEYDENPLHPAILRALSWAETALEKYELPPIDPGISFSTMGGMGTITCMDCGHTETVTSFTHGFDDEGNLAHGRSGHQCQSCWKFAAVDDTTADQIASECPCGGTLERSKKLRCPKCQSLGLIYKCTLMT